MVGPLPCSDKGNKYIIVVTDYFTKLPEACATPPKKQFMWPTSSSTFFFAMGVQTSPYQTKERKSATRYMCVLIFITITNSLFISSFIKTVSDILLELTGIEHRVTKAYHPQTNGFNQTLKDALIQVVNEEQNDWDLHIEKILFSYS